MNDFRPTRVLLLSGQPQVHVRLLESYGHGGVRVGVASSPSNALAQLRRGPQYVFVDLAHPARFSPALIRALNQDPRSSLILGLHEGSLEHLQTDLGDLVLDGFCRAEDLGEIRRFLLRTGYPPSAWMH